ncbi:MAG: hypothetical protein ASARMPREDX12_000347 [Alectoria sarmentosa]|nr:MAG: hypothetical protein ASARMPREDX12_000347 [Alectoria sarmentosa]
MSVGLPSDEVAEDYKNSLEDLTINSRYEISNLTVIAKENTEHAMAISRVLENHIKSTPPDRKLPALYVLDSVVKNVGTPYTLFLGRNLYTIFMNAYSLVNNQVRRKLDEMLKTWKEPVPGSLDPRPVFPAETIRPIENALIKARTAAVQAQQQQQSRAQQEMINRGRPMATPNPQWRSTPTPPQTRGPYYPPPQQNYALQNVPNGNYQARPQYPQTTNYPPPQPTPTNHQQPFSQPQAYPPYQQSPNHSDPIHQDVEKLISAARAEFSSNVNDDALRIRLQALLALQSALKSQTLTPQEFQAARNEVARLFAEVYGASGPAASAPPRTLVPSPYVPPPQIPPQQRPAQIPTPQKPDIQSLLSSRNLADIIAKAQQAPATPPISQATYSPAQPASQNSTTPSLSANLGDMLASLKAKGILSGASTTPVNGSHGYSPPPSTTKTPPIMSGGFPRPALTNDIEVTSISLKRPRIHLVSTLYEARPNQCSTCGRRFLATAEGKEKKARHLDWHFRTNQRLADSAKRGQNRSWYVDELEWIKSRDNPEDAPLADAYSDAARAALAASLAASDPKKKHIPVPSDPVLANQPCPICQEKFDMVWNDEVQDFVWMDAMKIGSRVYHASCHSEVKKEGGTTPLRMSTPDSVLGKRKAVSTDQWWTLDGQELIGLQVGDYNAGNAKAIKA